MSRAAEILLLCEDRQHETFVRRFLKRHLGPRAREVSRRLRVEMAHPGRGAADQYVLERFPHEVAAYRRQAGKRQTRLLVMIDGDRTGVEGRTQRFDDAVSGKADRTSKGQRRNPRSRSDLEHRDLAVLAGR